MTIKKEWNIFEDFMQTGYSFSFSLVKYHLSTTVSLLLFFLSTRTLSTHYIPGTVLGGREYRDPETPRLAGDIGTLIIIIQSVNRQQESPAQQILEALRSGISTFGGEGVL